MEINTVCISTEEYKQMVVTMHEQQRLLKKCRALLDDAIAPLAEYKSICKYFSERSWEKDCYDAWLQDRNEQPAKVGGSE